MSRRTDETLTVPTSLGALQVELVGSGPPALLWHSLFVDSTTWGAVRGSMSSSRSLVLVDGPGHGGSAPAGGPFDLGGCAQAAVEVLNHLAIDQPVDWAGNAWGGHVGIMFARTYPDRCRSLLAVGTPVRALTAAERRRVRLLLGLYRVAGPVPPLVSVLCGALLGTGASEPAVRLVGAAFRRAGRGGMVTAIGSASLRRPDLSAALAEVRAPTMFVAAADDGMWTPAEAAAAAKRLARGRCAVLPGGGHIAPLVESGPLLAELIAGFWEDPTGS